MDDQILVTESIKFANKKLPKQYDIIERSMAINALAHGYYMGAKFAQSKQKTFFRPFHKKQLDPNGLFQESHSAAVSYLKEKYPFIPETNKNLLKSSLSLGFREGYTAHAGV